ncbi:MAG: LysM peptidoglycan-binding domain-containing protein [Nitrospinaceae bacterium]|nr:LysM peptidoglycan-binding domain-containing protein [Nitrospinaceae bacterium]NIR57585.1 LysM peptidoglycan-binding domain-containing protein [Nitrospinaceae bacterium]NIS88055.1 LysM peptidoglycan-binding domain-containing protein [Nitrospinaceae bacterium]NIT84919.1 LysM peptidoglycan-binding domain-containing protein [Nitrospinaceae bacterium]NIU47095.1 LysM peptidoglycan-binding domain-containing protein [Nitrospinaceae bacterium]
MYDPIDTEELPLESFIDISTLEKYFGMHRREIAKYNPSLRRPVISGKRRIPKNFILKVPADRFSDPSELYASIPDNLKHRKQVRLRWYTVRWGDNLSTIARRLGTSVRKLKERNNIGRRNRIYRGQVLEIPGKGRARKSKAARVVHTTPDWSMVVIPKDLETIKYRVRRHDTLTRIARKYHVPVSVLAKMNRMDDPHALRRGQRILVPKPGTDFELKLAQALKAKNNGTKTAKLDVKVESAKAEKSTVTASTVETLDEGSKVSAKLAKYTDNISINKNRPAFRPIKIAARTQFDYPVGLIKVDYDETLSHIADWARVSVRELRRINHLRRRGSRISVNQSIKVPFRRVSAEEFEEKRQEYHKAIQEDFFSSYKVEKVVVHKLRRGETLWEISNSDEMIPLWLLGNYNPDKNFGSLSAGETIKIPILAENPS